MVKGITKYSVFVEDPESIAYHLERAWYVAQNGRPGPCWLDIPVDVQSAEISPDKLKHYDSAEDALVFDPAPSERAGCRCVDAHWSGEEARCSRRQRSPHWQSP